MVNRIPAYMISAGGKFAILASRAHPHSVQIMAEGCKLALQSCGVENEDIYIIDSPTDLALPGLSRETAKTGFFSAIVVLSALEDGCRFEQAIATALASTDFDVPVVPALVPCGAGEAKLAAAGEEAARAAVELTNVSTLFEELTIAASTDVLDELAVADIIHDVEQVEEALNAARRAPAGRSSQKARNSSRSDGKSSPSRRKKRAAPK